MKKRFKGIGVIAAADLGGLNFQCGEALRAQIDEQARTAYENHDFDIGSARRTSDAYAEAAKAIYTGDYKTRISPDCHEDRRDGQRTYIGTKVIEARLRHGHFAA